MKTQTTSPIIFSGKKKNLLEQIQKYYPSSCNNYIEPFCGGASVFFDFVNADNYILSDLNWRLIRLYEVIRDDLPKMLEYLTEFLGFSNKCNLFYALRQVEDIKPPISVEISNELTEWANTLCSNKTALAAKDYFLNRMTKNGWRENKSGQFNLAYYSARHEDYFYKPSLLLDARKKLKNADLFSCCYTETLKLAKPGDFVYLDPPYMPVSATANFTAYTSNGFDLTQQIRLAEQVKLLQEKGIQFLLSNSIAAKDYYESFANLEVIETRGYNSNNRTEILITNAKQKT